MIETQKFLDLKDLIRASIAEGNFPAALEWADTALEEALATGDAETADLATCNRSAVLIEAGDFASELASLKSILMRTGNPVVAFSAAYSTARIYQERRDFKKAIFYSRIAREKSQLVEDHPGRGHALNQLGTLCLYESRIPEAIEAYRRARTLFEDAIPQDRLALAFLDDNLGYCFLLDGQHSEGFRYCLKGLRAFEALGAEAYTAQPHLDLCYGYLEAQQFEPARFHGEQALAIARKHNVNEVLKNALYLLGEVCHLSGDATAADECFDELAGRYPEVRYLKDFLFAVDLKKVINLRL